MSTLALVLVLVGADPADGLAKTMLPIYVKEISEYSMAVESDPKKELELQKEPVHSWTNPVREGHLVDGVVFLWLRDGRPAALGGMFSHPAPGWEGRKILHEFLALDRDKLLVRRPSGALNEWKPQAGLARKELPDAGTPGATRRARLVQMRRLAQEFGGYEIDLEGERWESRMLPTPLYRYPAAGASVVDGALFVLVTNSGTAPLVLLLLEAREASVKLHWEYTLCRKADRSLYVHRKGREVWSMVMGGENVYAHDPLHVYRSYPDKVVTPEGKLLARMRLTPKEGEVVIPVDEK